MRLLSAAAAACAMWLSAASAGAQSAQPTLVPPLKQPVGPAATATPQVIPGAAVSRPLTAPDVEAWLDGYMPYALKSGDVAGAVVVVVKDGQVLLQKGYGYADVKTRAPVDPERTLFRPGSVSKLFTWTAVMQQVEQGKIDLDADINTYLDFKIPPHKSGKPITMRDVMTHTAGFEEAIKGLINDNPRTLIGLGPTLKRWTPERIFAPGTTPAYSNYATALAGYVVERTSGLDFDTYLERNIFGPLGMTRSTFRQPLPAGFESMVSKGYSRASTGEAKPFELIPLAPAGSMTASGADMAKFMIAHLQGGGPLLSPDTARTMHTSMRTVLPPLNRMALGFYEQNTNGRRVIAHGGDTQWFHTYLFLYPDDNVGLYVSMNSSGREGAAGAIRMSLLREFSDRYLPGPSLEGQVDAKTAAEHARMIAGSYENSRRPQSSLVSILGLIGEAKVTANKDGTISASLLRDAGGAVIKWREVAPFVWREVGGKSRLAAQVVDGKVVRWSVDDFSPFMMFEPAPAARSPAWLLPATIASLAVLVLTVVLWPVSAIVRRRYGKAFPLEGREALAHRLVRIGAIASTAALVAWGVTVVSMLENLGMMSSALDPWLYTLHILGTIAVVAGFLIALWNASVVWRGGRSWFAKLWSLALVLATFIVLWVAVVFHLVGLGVNY
jgi:CubicO group peptidase (beta-lactamase class C family)